MEAKLFLFELLVSAAGIGFILNLIPSQYAEFRKCRFFSYAERGKRGLVLDFYYIDL